MNDPKELFDKAPNKVKPLITMWKMLKKIERERYIVDKQFKEISGKLELLESKLSIALGIEYVDREPGFACLRIKGLFGYHNTPEDAFYAFLKKVIEETTPLEKLTDRLNDED